MQLLVGLSFGSLMLTLLWRFNRSEWAAMRVVDLPRELRARSGRRTLAEILARARDELMINPTITVYEILDDGYELRRPANPFAGVRASFDRLSHSARSMSVSLSRLGDEINIAMRGGRP